MMKSWDLGALATLSIRMQIWFLVMWFIVVVAAVVQDVFIVSREAREAGLDPVGRPGKLAAYSLTPSLIVALAVTIKILLDLDAGESSHLVRYIAPIWIMCYGMGVYAAGLFSVRLPRILGLAFIVTGALSLLVFIKFGVIMVALTFGLFHILFGIIVRRRAVRNSR